jgi:hypothetical protein
VSDFEVDGELVSEEDADAVETDSVRALPREYEPDRAALPALRTEMTTAAIAVAGGALAGAATVAAVRAVAGGGAKRRGVRLPKRARANNVVASRSFLVDVHMLGR